MNLAEALQSSTTVQAALNCSQLGVSTIPLWGKKPPRVGQLGKEMAWKWAQSNRADQRMIYGWHGVGWLKNVGIVCGDISNLVVIDLDGIQAIALMKRQFPILFNTLIVNTGSGKGKHLYLAPKIMPPTTRATGLVFKGQILNANIELRANGCYVVAPPSIHPDTHQPYYVSKAAPILQVDDLTDVVQWLTTMRPPTTTTRRDQNQRSIPAGQPINRRLISAIADALMGKGYRLVGQRWVFGACLFAERHKHSDKSPSFGFDTHTGRANCYTCGGFVRTIDICIRLGIDVNRYGGLWEKQ